MALSAVASTSAPGGWVPAPPRGTRIGPKRCRRAWPSRGECPGPSGLAPRAQSRCRWSPSTPRPRRRGTPWNDRRPRLAHQGLENAAHRHEDQVVGWAKPVRSILPEPRERAVYEPRVSLVQMGVPDAQAVRHAWAVALDHNVGSVGEAAKDTETRLFPQVECQRLLVPVESQVFRGNRRGFLGRRSTRKTDAPRSARRQVQYLPGVRVPTSTTSTPSRGAFMGPSCQTGWARVRLPYLSSGRNRPSVPHGGHFPRANSEKRVAASLPPTGRTRTPPAGQPQRQGGEGGGRKRPPSRLHPASVPSAGSALRTPFRPSGRSPRCRCHHPDHRCFLSPAPHPTRCSGVRARSVPEALPNLGPVAGLLLRLDRLRRARPLLPRPAVSGSAAVTRSPPARIAHPVRHFLMFFSFFPASGFRCGCRRKSMSRANATEMGKCLEDEGISGG